MNREIQSLRTLVGNHAASLISATGKTQTQVAKETGLQAPDISNIMKGKLDGISIERLFTLITKLNCNVTINFTTTVNNDIGKMIID